MKYIFIVQGEGRGHMTQALTLSNLLRERGHEIVKVLVGKSPSRKLPDFFVNGINAPVIQFESMNFMPSADNRRPNMISTMLFNSFNLHRYYPSIKLLRDEIAGSGADAVVNFYELLAGLTYFFHELNIPMVSIGHQYLFLHKDFGLPLHKYPGAPALDFYTKLTSAGSVKHLALSFRPMERDMNHNLVVVPPLLRPEVLALKPTRGDYIHGYMLNSGFATEVREWHAEHPQVPLRFFWDNWEAGKVDRIDDTLSFYLIDDQEFLQQMAGCRAYASTAGFESICEAMYLGKPILMVPSHIEQEINGFDAARAGAGIVCDSFDLSRLVEFSRGFEPDETFPEWVRSAPEMIIAELERPDGLLT